MNMNDNHENCCGGNCGCNHEQDHNQDHDHNHCHDHNHDHEEIQTINLELEDGTKLKCIVLTTFELNDKEYIALVPEGEEDVFLYQFKEIDGGLELINIENDEEFELVSKEFYEIVEEEE